MASERTSNTYPNRRIGSQGQVTCGWSSVCRESGNFIFNNKLPQFITPEQTKTSSKTRIISFDSETLKSNLAKERSFDICMREAKSGVELNKSLLELNRERRKRAELEARQNVSNAVYLRPGMVLLKNCLAHHDQVA